MRPISCLLLTAVLSALPATARAQFAQQPLPSRDAPNPNPNIQAVARPNILDQPVTPQVAPQYGYGAAPNYGAPYGVGYGGRGVGNYLNGVANVTTANAQGLVTIQAARQGQAQADAAQLDYRRRLFDEMKYERMNSTNAEDIRAYEREQAIRRASNDPPQVEIWDGTSLNALLKNIQQTQDTTGARGPCVPLDTGVLAHIGVTTGVTVAGANMFASKLRWPQPMAVSRYKANRDQIEKLVNQAVAQVRKDGTADADTMVALNGAIKDFQGRTDADIASMTPSDSIRCDRYLNELRTATKVLDQPNAANYFNGTWAAQGRDVGELIAYMSKNGLKFGPANRGDESYYTSLYQSVLTYDSGLMRLVSR
jgi:hypothetical protein